MEDANSDRAARAASTAMRRNCRKKVIELFSTLHVFLIVGGADGASKLQSEEITMTDVRVPSKSWVVVCDGAKALILQNAGDIELMNLKVEETLSQPNEPDREIGADKPGRTHAANGQSVSAVEQTDWHEQAEAQFLKQVAVKMDLLVREKNARNIILVAPPKALGTLRSSLTPQVQAAISAEVPKDYINLPVDQIERHLAA
ncbi:protein required for attachment to host cells [Rhizobium sp. BK661]|nr:protein required for attachment to host cells [Rhizobium sp. BK661]